MSATRILPAAAMAALVLVAPAAAGSGARFEGRWRATYEPVNFDGKTSRAHWSVTPECGRGACSVKVRARGVPDAFELHYEPSTGGYHGTYRYTIDCTDASGSVLVPDAYNGKIRFDLKVREADDDDVATRIAGRRGSTYTLNSAGRGDSRCKPQGRGKVEHVEMTPAG